MLSWLEVQAWASEACRTLPPPPPPPVCAPWPGVFCHVMSPQGASEGMLGQVLYRVACTNMRMLQSPMFLRFTVRASTSTSTSTSEQSRR